MAKQQLSAEQKQLDIDIWIIALVTFGVFPGEGRSKFLCLFFRGTAPGSRVYNREMKDGGMSLLYHLRF